MKNENQGPSCGCNVRTAQSTEKPAPRCACGEACRCGEQCRCEGCSHRKQ